VSHNAFYSSFLPPLPKDKVKFGAGGDENLGILFIMALQTECNLITEKLLNRVEIIKKKHRM
jgi:hypothetical protein